MVLEPWVWETEREALKGLLPDIFGYYILQLGAMGGKGDLLEGSRIPHRFGLDTEGKVHIAAHFEALPVANDSVDVLVLPHTLERSEAPYEVLREAERILVPEGRLIILGFHPLGFSNLRVGLPPWKLKAWCTQLGLHVLQKTGFGGRLWPFPANLYLLMAKKRVAAITPIRPHWQLKPSLGRIRQPAAKVANG